jgi:hypothetical protein
MHAAHQQLSPGQATPLPQGSRSQTSIPYPNIDSSGVQGRSFVAESSSPHPLSFSHKDRARCRSLYVPGPGEKKNAECTDPPNLPDREALHFPLSALFYQRFVGVVSKMYV